MNKNLSWLVDMTAKTDFEFDLQEFLENQSEEIKLAYKMNDQAALRKLFSNECEKLAFRNTIVQI